MMARHPEWHQNTMLFLLSQGVTLFGSQIVQMAVVWYVTMCTDSGMWIAAFSISSYLPQFFLSFPGGELADRYHKKYLIILADFLIAMVTLVMMLLLPNLRDDRDLLHALLAMSVVRSAGAGIQVPAVGAMIAQLVPAEEYSKYNGINATIQSVVQFAAPATAMFALTVGSLRETLAIDIVTAIAGVGVLLRVREKQSQSRNRRHSVIREAREGVQYVCTAAAVRNALVIYGLFQFWSVPAGYLSGLHVSREYGDSYWYLTAVEMAGFGGMALGGILMSSWRKAKQLQSVLIAGLSVFGSMAITMTACGNLLTYLVCMIVYGVAMTVIQITITTILQESGEAAMHGRIFGLMSSIYASCYPVGMIAFGALADRIPLKWMMIASGAALNFMAAYECGRKKRMSIGER